MKFFFKRFFIAWGRFLVAILLVLFLIELSYAILGKSGRHVWDLWEFQLTPPELFGAANWLDLIARHLFKSVVVLGIVAVAVGITGYFWGVLAARLRVLRFVELLSLPFGLLASLPSFWIISGIVLYTVQRLNRPGFANELVLGSGFTLMDWWHASLIAVVLTFYPAVWIIRNTSAVITERASANHLRSLFIRGYSNRDIFYKNILPLARPKIVNILQKNVSPILGALIPIEWAFKYQGIGSLFVDMAKLGNYEGLFIVSSIFVAIIVIITFFSELVEKKLTPKGFHAAKS